MIDRKAVMTLLQDEEWGKWSNVAIANQCAVSEHLVRSLRPSRSSKDAPLPPRTYTTKHGTTATMDTRGPINFEDLRPGIGAGCLQTASPIGGTTCR